MVRRGELNLVSNYLHHLCNYFYVVQCIYILGQINSKDILVMKTYGYTKFKS